WPDSSRALPLRYQAAVRVMGFGRAEGLAARLRTKRTRHVRDDSAIAVAAGPAIPETSLPLVSILIPCYNAEQWIGNCIRSALEQDYPNKEVIVLDDGSTDGSLKVVESFRNRIAIHPGPHAGANAARNRLTALAGGEWLQYLDADDHLLQGKLASQVRAL